MTTKHTPGPWMYGGHLFDSRVLAKEAPPSWDSRTIAVVDHTEDVMGEANAHLIAAAPDLLAACEEALEAFADLGIDETMPLLHGRIRAAIAKVKGEPK